MYKNLLETLNSNNIDNLVLRITEGSLDSKQFHNKKYYAKNNKDITPVLELTVAWEICKHKGVV